MVSIPNPPDKTVPYTVANDPVAGALFLYGDANASKIVLLCGGYADDHSIFQDFASKLADENFCLAGVMCLPGYDDRPERPWTSHNKGGYTFDEMTNAVRSAAKSLREASENKKAEFTVIFHDWGVLPGSRFVNRIIKEENSDIKPAKVVHFDVLLSPHPDTKDIPKAQKPTFYETFITLFYRVVFSIAFLLQRDVANIVALMFFFPCVIFMGIFKLGPVKKHDDEIFEKFPKDFSRILYMAYPYYTMMRDYFSGVKDSEATLHTDLKGTPVLYMSGLDKRVQFHDYRSLKLLEREESEGRSKCKVINLTDAGHYLFIQKEKKCLDAVKDFMLD